MKHTGYTSIYILQNIQYIDKLASSIRLISDDYILLVVTAGTGKFTVHNGVTKVEKGAVFIIAPNETSTLDATKELSFYQINLKIVASEQKKHTTPPLLRCHGKINCTPFSICLDLVLAIYELRKAKDEVACFEQFVKLQELLLFIVKQNQLFSFERTISQTVDDSIDYVQQNYQQPLTVVELAEKANLSKWQYTKLFEEKTGQAPGQYLNQIRIEQAKKLLVMTDDRLHSIAENIGYSNEYYFNRRFKQTVGVSPGQYRRNHGKNIKVFAPYLEDFLLALGITPVAQSFHAGWGKQNYLNLLQVPAVDITETENVSLLRYKPEFIVVEDGIDRWISLDRLKQLAPTYKVSHPGEQWRETLRTVADLLCHVSRAEEVIFEYEEEAKRAKRILSQKMKNETVACLRISAHDIALYAGAESGYTGPILYKDLGLKPPLFVKHLPPEIRRIELTLEELSQLDADHLFITLDHADGEKITLFDQPLWKSLPAVKNKQVYEVDFFTWMNHGVLSHFKKIGDIMNVLAKK